MNNKFWNFITTDSGERILRIEGPIDADDAWNDSVTPGIFRKELEAGNGDITVWINSPGGNVFAAASIYSMLCEYKGRVTVKIDALAASAASVIAMAGDKILMSPVACLMIHDPMTMAMGNIKDMEKVISTLKEIKESIINAYARKSGLDRETISNLMSEETWLNAKKAVELGFADEILFEGDKNESTESWGSYSSRVMGRQLLNRLIPSTKGDAVTDEVQAGQSDEETNMALDMNGKTKDGSMPYELLRKQLDFLK